MTKWNLKNASEKEKEIYRQEFEKVYQKELQRRTPVVPASKSVSVDTPKTAAQKQNRAAVKSGGPVLMPMAQKERQREAQQRTAQQFQQFGMDPTAIVGQQIGQWAGDVLHRKAAETGIDPGKSKAAYIAEKTLGGAATSVEGTYNNILDNARAQVNAQLTNGYVTDTGVNLRDMQNFWAAVFGGKHAQYAQDTQAADKAVAEQLPAAADRLRSTKAAEYAQGLDEKYGATGLWKVGGDVASGIGGMLPNIVLNKVVGGTWGKGLEEGLKSLPGMVNLMSSAAGNAAAQARAYGADEDTALVYGLLSGATEGATEKIVGGIPGLGGGWMDKVIQRVAGSSAGRRAVKRLSDVFGEGLEEALSELIGSQLEKMYLNREDWRSGGEILQDTAYSMLLGALTSAAMNAPGDIRTRRTGAKINALGGANDVISEGLRAPADGDVDGNADRLSLAAELARRATDGAKLSNADLGELYQMNARTGQQLFTLPMLEQRADQWAAEAEAAQDAKKDAASAIKTDYVDGNPVSIGDAATSLNTIIPQKQGDSKSLPVIRMPMAQQAMPASKAEAKATNAQLLEKLRGSIPEIQGMQPVAEITGKEFAKNTEKNLVQQVGDYFRTLGNKVFRRGLGEVVLDERGVKDSMAHGIGRRKAAAFAAVPQVIAQGRQIDTQQNWKGRGYDTLVFAAPVKVGSDTNYIAAVVTKSTENNRYYLHEVVDQNGNIIYQKKDAANAIKTDSVTGEPASIGGATTSFDNIVPQSGENATDGGRFLPPMAGDAAQSGARQNAEADTPGVILPPMKGKPDTTAAPGDGLQLNAKEETAPLNGTSSRKSGGPDLIVNGAASENIVPQPGENATERGTQPAAKAADAPVNTAEKDPATLDKVKLLLEDENAGFGNGVHTSFELAAGLGNKGVSYSKDLGRNLDAAAGKDKSVRQWLRDTIEKPFYAAKKAYAQGVVRQMNGYKKAMDELGIKAGSKESKAVMWYGEGRRKVKGGEYQDYTLTDLKRDFPENWENIQKADAVNRKMYDDYVESINAALEKIYPHPMEDALRKRDRIAANLDYYERLLAKAETPEDRQRLQTTVTLTRGQLQTLQSEIDSGDVLRNKRLTPRADYYRHAQEIKQGFGQLAQILSTRSDIDTGLVGVSDFTKPKSKWAGFMQQRTGSMNYSEDSVAAMVDYIKGAEYKINIDPVIADNRSVVKGLVEQTKNTRNANKFIEWLTEWTNDLAGKTNMIDRPFQKMLDRTPMKALRWLNNRVKANAVVGNLNSAVSQFFNLPNATAYIKNPKDWTVGAGIYMQSLFGKGKAADAMAQSGFLTERYAMDKAEAQFDEGIFKTPEKLANWMLTFGDEQAARLIWSSAYSRAVRQAGKGNNSIDPISYADDITRRCVAGRGVGEVPIVQKSEIVKLIAPFQVEVNNAWQLLKERVKEKDALGILFVFLTSWLMNSVSEALTGNRVAYDPIDAIADGVKNAQDEAEQDGRSTGFGDYAVSIGGRLAGETLSAMPFGSQISSNILGLDSALGYNAEKFFGDSDPTRYGVGTVGASAVVKPLAQLMTAEDKTNVDLVSPALNVLLPWGGKQVSRTLGAAQDMGHLPQGPFGLPVLGERETVPGSYSASGALRFPIDTSDPLNVVSGYAFGSYGTKEGKEYQQNGANPYSAKATEAYRAVYPLGGGDKFLDVLPMLDTNGKGGVSAGEVTQGLEGHGLTPEQKAAVWQVYASDEAKAKYKAAQAVGAGEQYILMLPMLDADKNGSVSTKELESAMNGRGLTRKQQAALWYEYASDKQRMNYEKAAEYGLESAYSEMMRYADTNNSGTLNKDELRAWLDSTGLDRAQKALLFSLASTAKNPYE